MISILCTDRLTNYRFIPGLDLWPKERNAYNFASSNPVITHAPCQQWSLLHHLAKPDLAEKELAMFCLEKVKANGGIFEHPAYSKFFAHAGIKPTVTIEQSWWGFPARKRTWLYMVGCEPLPFPGERKPPRTNVEGITSTMRSRMPLAFCEWLVGSVLTLERG